MWSSVVVVGCLLFRVAVISAAETCTGHIADGKCYTLSTADASWQDAVSDCNSLASDVMIVTSSAAQTRLEELMVADAANSVWLGGRLTADPTDSKLLWRWVSDDSVLSAQGCYRDSEQSPDLPDQVQVPDLLPAKCVSKCEGLNKRYAGVQAGEKCFCGDSFGTYGLQWACSTKCTGYDVRCGGPSHNSIYYVDGTGGDWAYAQPNNYAEFQDCGLVSLNTKMKLEDEYCYKSYFYICDVAASRCAATSSGRTGFQSIAGRCFYVSDALQSWFNARSACVALGGDLAKVASASTQLALNVALFSDRESDRGARYWVGLVRRDWHWHTTDPFRFTAWTSQRPDTPQGQNYDCIESNVADNYLWRNSDCASKRRYYCVSDAASTTAAATTTTAATTTGTTTMSKATTSPSTTTTTTTTTKQTTASATKPTSPTTTKSTPSTKSTSSTGSTKTTPPGVTSSITTPPKTTTTTQVIVSTTALPGGNLTNTTSSGNATAAPPQTGASTGGSSGLTDVEIVLIVLCVILIILVIIVVIVLCYYKAKYRNSKVSPDSRDVRHVADVPYNGKFVGDDGYATNSEFGSMAGLTKPQPMAQSSKYNTVVEDQ